MYDVENLGECLYRSPLSGLVSFVSDATRILIDPEYKSGCKPNLSDSFEVAGPREKIFFNPDKTKAAIVTCGGLCPGLNDVIRALFFELKYRYGVSDVLGIRYGYAGFAPELGYGEPIKLDAKLVDSIHMSSGTILGSSRGQQDVSKILDYIEKQKINILFTIGGDGTLRGAKAISEEAGRRGYLLSVVGIPKTIDNDISFISKSFGFDTAVNEASSAIITAHSEAKGYYNGVGLVKLMGRHSGFIACDASLAVNDANFVLIPELDFDLYGPNGFLEALFLRLRQRNHAVVVVAEGAGQNLFKDNNEFDASGNKKLNDIGIFLKEEIKKYSKKVNIIADVKYIDPSYMIRSTPTISNDGIYCIQLAQNAVHAAMAGKTNMVVGKWSDRFTNVDIDLVISKRKQVDPESSLWRNVLEATGQPISMKN